MGFIVPSIFFIHIQDIHIRISEIKYHASLQKSSIENFNSHTAVALHLSDARGHQAYYYSFLI